MHIPMRVLRLTVKVAENKNEQLKFSPSPDRASMSDLSIRGRATQSRRRHPEELAFTSAGSVSMVLPDCQSTRVTQSCAEGVCLT